MPLHTEETRTLARRKDFNMLLSLLQYHLRFPRSPETRLPPKGGASPSNAALQETLNLPSSGRKRAARQEAGAANKRSSAAQYCIVCSSFLCSNHRVNMYDYICSTNLRLVTKCVVFFVSCITHLYILYMLHFFPTPLFKSEIRLFTQRDGQEASESAAHLHLAQRYES